MPDTYRAVVLGCGRIGAGYGAARPRAADSHARALHAGPRTELVGLADADAGRRATAASTWGITPESDPVALCTALMPDIVVLATPDASHAPLARAILSDAPPRALVIEKPMALSSGDARTLVAAARAKGVQLFVNYSRRFLPAFQLVQRELAAGLYGAPRLCRMVYGKGLVHNGTHALDLLRWWLGEPKSVSGGATAWGPDGDPSQDVSLTFAGGARASLVAFDERVATVFDMDLLTERSRIRFWLGGGAWEFMAAIDGVVAPGYRHYVDAGPRPEPAFKDPLRDATSHTLANVVASLDGKAAPLCTGADGVAALDLAERARSRS